MNALCDRSGTFSSSRAKVGDCRCQTFLRGAGTLGQVKKTAGTIKIMIIPVLGSQVENSAALVDVVHLLDDDLVILSKLTKAPPPRRRRRKVAAFPYAIIHHDCRCRNTRPRQMHVFAADIFQERVGPVLEDVGERNVAKTRRSTRCTASSAPLALSPRCRRRPCTSTFRRTNVLFPSRVFGTLRHIMAMRRRMMWLSSTCRSCWRTKSCGCTCGCRAGGV